MIWYHLFFRQSRQDKDPILVHIRTFWNNQSETAAIPGSFEVHDKRLSSFIEL